MLTADQVEAIRLGTLYALGHGAVVIALGLAALAFGALLPDWLDPIMGRVVGLTLVLLGRLGARTPSTGTRGPASRSGSAAAGCSCSTASATAGGTLQARLHGHEHVEPLEMSSYGTKTAFGVGMIHGIGAETGTQVLLIAAVGGAAERGPRRPDAVRVRDRPPDLELRHRPAQLGRASSRARPASGIYVAIGAVAGCFSLVIGIDLPVRARRGPAGHRALVLGF